jgi:hypothetical protein
VISDQEYQLAKIRNWVGITAKMNVATIPFWPLVASCSGGQGKVLLLVRKRLVRAFALLGLRGLARNSLSVGSRKA